MSTQITQVYDDYVIQTQAAYAGFSSIYEAKNPKPIPATIRRDFVSMLIVIALSVVMAASIIVSGSRTISEFGGEGIGTVAFVMIECGIAVYALFRARRNANPKRLQNTVKWATVGLVLTFFIAVAANIDATLKAHKITISQDILSIINLAVAVSAPALAFISSDVLAIELMATDIQRREALRQYDEQCREWLNDLNRSWNSNQSKWVGKIEVQKADGRADTKQEQLSALSAADGQRTDTDGQQHGFGSGYTKRTDARTRVSEHLTQFPDDAFLNVRDLASKIGVGKTVAAEVMKEFKSK
jgi:hypothetical protein